MTQVELGTPGMPRTPSRTRAVPATLIAVTPVAYRRESRTVRLTHLGVIIALWLTLALALAPVGPSVTDDLAAATQARTSYRYDRALEWYATAKSSAPTDPRPLCLTGDVRGLQQEWSLAATAYQQCLALHPTNPASAWLGLGNARASLGDVSGAVTAWQRSADAGGLDAMRRLGSGYESAGNVAAAVASWRRLPANDAEARVHLGMLALWQGNITTAHADFVAARAQPSAYAQALADNGFLALASLPSFDAEAWGKLGYSFLVANLPALAITSLRTATRLDPQSDSAHAYLSWTLWLLSQQGQTPDGTPASYAAAAHNEVESALALNSTDSFAWFTAGNIAAASGDLDNAYRDLTKAIALDKRNPAIWSAAGQLALAQSDYLATELDFGTAAQLATRPDESVTLLHFFADHGYGMQTGRAMAAAAAATQRWPKSEPIRFLQAQIADESGKADTATYAAQTALLLDPTDPAPYVLLGRYASEAGQYVTAAGYLRVALALRPQGPLASQATALLAPLRSLDV